MAILSGGELTVTVRGQGRGGPNQEYALALAGLLRDTPDISALAADTDGADGGAGSATDPAGAMIDAATFAKMKSLGLDPKAYLDNNDATTFFTATGDLAADRPDADQCERYQGDFGGLSATVMSGARARSARTGNSCETVKHRALGQLRTAPRRIARGKRPVSKLSVRSCPASPAARRGWRDRAIR